MSTIGGVLQGRGCRRFSHGFRARVNVSAVAPACVLIVHGGLVLRRAEGAKEAWLRRGSSEALEMLLYISLKVEVELRDRKLNHAPHRFPEVGHESHQHQRVGVAGSVG